jgi:dipeptidyl-peptidase-4
MKKLGLSVLLAWAAFAQKKPVTLETLAEGARRGVPGAALWAPDGQSFAFRQDGGLRVYAAAAKTSRQIVALRELDAAAVKPASGGEPFDWTNRRVRTGDMQWSADGKSLLSVAGGDVFLIHVETGNWEQLTKTPATEIDPKLSPDGSKVVFRRGWDLYTVDVQSKKETRLTSGGSETLRNGGLDWVYPEEIGLSTAFWWSPDSKSVAYLQFDTSREPVYPHEDLLGARAVFEPQTYPQAGENNATVRLGVIPAGGGSTRWLDVGDTRDTYLIARVGWMPNARSVYVMRTNRVQNRLEALAIDVESGTPSTLFRESDPYWINLRGDPEFLKDGKRFLWTSERDGYRHLYLYSNDGNDVKQLTRGNWEVAGIAGVDEAAGRVFYVSNEPGPLESHLYVAGLDGQNKRRLTDEPGTHGISMGPGGAYYLDTYSSLSAPPRTMLRAGDGQALMMYRGPDPRQTEYDVLPTEIVPFHGPDGTMLYGRLIKPAGFQPGRKYPVVVNVYGGPNVNPTVRDAWQGITIDQVLAHKGYVIWQADNRGGPGRGHAFETAIYHKLGVNELADQVAGVQHLISLGFVDAQRIGIRGWSYGGFMTVNALLNAPGVFRAGFAGAPVTSWLNYDTIYTERYMGLPKDDPEGYRETALPQHAANLKGKLMLVHDFEDDNVLFQNTLQLTKALQYEGKQFEMMLYPQKTHGVTGAPLRQMNEMMIEFFDRSLR